MTLFQEIKESKIPFEQIADKDGEIFVVIECPQLRAILESYPMNQELSVVEEDFRGKRMRECPFPYEKSWNVA